ncbi:MAG: hypothetical protein MR679_08510 [Bacteroidales bacterium]|nr:hypothetical protein [Bacteroidales bacterium]
MKPYTSPRSLALSLCTEHPLLSLSTTDENVDDSDKTQRRGSSASHPIWGDNS